MPDEEITRDEEVADEKTCLCGCSAGEQAEECDCGCHNQNTPDTTPTVGMRTEQVRFLGAEVTGTSHSFLLGQNHVKSVEIGDTKDPMFRAIRIEFDGTRKPRIYVVPVLSIVMIYEPSLLVVPPTPSLVVPGDSDFKV